MDRVTSSAGETRDFEQRLRLLSDLAREFTAATSAPDSVLTVVARGISETFGDLCAIRLVSAERGILESIGAVHHPDPVFLALATQATAAHPQRIGEGITGRVAATGEAVFIPVVDTALLLAGLDPERRGSVERQHISSLMVVPLLLAGHVIGVLSLSRSDPERPYQTDDLRLIQDLALHAALAIANARLLASAQAELAERERMAARLRVLAAASHEFSEETADYDRLLASVARSLGEAIGDLCFIRSLSDDGTMLEAGIVYHRDPDIVRAVYAAASERRLLLGEGLPGTVAASGRALFMPVVSAHEYAAGAPPESRELILLLQVSSLIVAPILCRGRVVGVVTLARSGPGHPYTESDLHLVENLADHAGLALANARSYAAERASRAAAVAANQALHESEEAHRLLFEASPVPLFVFDVTTLVPIGVNRHALELFGYEREDFLKLRVTEHAVHGHDTAQARLAAWGEAESAGTSRYRRRDRSEFVGEYTTRALTFSGQRARITTIKDVTERHEAERVRALLAAIVKSSNDAIVSKRLDGTITSWNEAAERLFGYPAEEVLAGPITIIVPEDSLDEERTLIARVAAGERIDHYETLRLRKDGSTVPVSLSLAPIFDGSGQVVGASKTARDLSTQRKAAEILERREAQLRQAQKMEAVGRLAGGVAHDFNNVLSVILGYGSVLLEDLAPNDPMRGDVEQICSAGARASELTRQLLMFSRQQIVNPRVLDLNDLLFGMTKMLKRLLGEDIDMTSISGSEIGRIRADPSSVEQVIMNLVVNARDAMPTGGKLTLETRDVELDLDYAREHLGSSPGPHVMLAVTDTGTGMDAATQAHIFEPFFTTKGAGQGTGLGLSMVFGIARQCGGSVWVYSELGCGTTFKVYFPRVDAAVETNVVTQTPISVRGSETILVVEDQDQVRAIVQNILKRNGYFVIAAQNAGEALMLAEGHAGRVELLLTDVVMPQMSGAELAKRLAAARPGLKVLFMSGYTDDSIVRHGVLESEVAFLQKPFTPDSLSRKVREVLDA